MSYNGVRSASPILETNEHQSERDDFLPLARAQKCSCRSIWCPYCFKFQWIPKQIKKLEQFRWPKTRQVVLTFSRDSFEDGQAAWKYTKDHSLVSRFIRNLKRGLRVRSGKKWIWKFKPVKIKRWRWFLEWHKDGFPHYHIFIEVESEGKEGMIGQDFIHYYWPHGVIIKEKPFKSLPHWRNMVGDLKRFGYFGKKKSHQTKLPAWAADQWDIKIYRSGGSSSKRPQEKDAWDIYCENAIAKAKVPVRFSKPYIDPKTGEIRKKTYGEKISECGKRTKLKFIAAGKTIEGIFKIPYHKVVKQFKGVYIRGEGFVFKIGKSDLAKLMGVIEKVTLYRRHKRNVWARELVGMERWKYYLEVEDYSRGGFARA